MDRFQRRNIIVLMILQLLGGTIALIMFLLTDISQQAITGMAIFLPILLLLFLSYWRYHWQHAPAINVVFGTWITTFFLLDPSQSLSASTALYLPAALTVVMLNSSWTLVIGIVTYLLVAYQAAPESAYMRIDQMLAYGVVITCLVAGRRSTERAQAAAELALSDSHVSHEQLKEIAFATQTQAEELMQKNADQEKLFQLVAELELPLVNIGVNTVLVPLIGHLDSRRMKTITERLLNAISQQNIQQVVLDISGVHLIEVAHIDQLMKLIKATRLLGTEVLLSGISSDVAATLAIEGINLSNITIVRSPHEALQYLQLINTATVRT